MATKYWTGNGVAVAQVWTATISSLDATPSNNTFTVTVGGVATTVTGTTSPTVTAAAMATALTASTHPYLTEVTWTSNAGTIIGTANTAGVAFSAIFTKAGAGSASIIDFVATVPNAGPNSWSTPANWSSGTIPVDTDDIIFKDSNVSVVWDLTTTITLNSLTIFKSYTGKIGLDRLTFATSSDAETTDDSHTEYRTSYLFVKCSGVVKIGEHYGSGSPAGSGRIMLDLSTTATTVEVFGTASSSSDSGRPAVRLKLVNSSNNVFVRSAPGGVGIAVDAPGEVSTVGTLSVSDTSTNARVETGPGTTLTTFQQTGGTNVLQAAATITTATINGGILTTEGDYTITTVNLSGGTYNSNHIKTSGNAITTANLSGGTLDGRGSNRARTWSTLALSKGAKYIIDPAYVTTTTVTDPTSGGAFTCAIS